MVFHCYFWKKEGVFEWNRARAQMEREITFKSHPFPGAAAGLFVGGGGEMLL